MKPSATASVPQRARRSAVECTPPKLVASATSSQRGEEALRALGARQREADERPAEARIWRAATAWAGVVREPRVRTSSTPRRRAAAGQRQRVRALALEPQRRASRASGAASQASNGAGDRARPACASARSALGQLGVARRRRRRAAGRSGRRAPWSR